MVSVPYRGATFLNGRIQGHWYCSWIRFRPLSGSYISQYRQISSLEKKIESFRPLSGSYISQLSTNSLLFIKQQFPSPIGELHFSMYQIFQKSIRVYSFRPLSGSYISQYYLSIMIWVPPLFPSPIGELHFSIPSPQPHVLSGTNRGIAGEK